MNPTPEDNAAAMRSRIAELAIKFIDRSREELATMRAGLDRLRGGDTQALQEIRNLAHRAAGTGATLGFGALSDKARDIEKIAEAQEPGAVPDAATLERLGSALDALEAELARMPRGAA